MGIIIEFISGLILAIEHETSSGNLWKTTVNVKELFSVLAMILIIGLIGIIDDLVHICQSVKALTTFFSTMPLAAIEAGYTILKIP